MVVKALVWVVEELQGDSELEVAMEVVLVLGKLKVVRILIQVALVEAVSKGHWHYVVVVVKTLVPMVVCKVQCKQ